MFSDGYENYCSALVDSATGRQAPARADLCACDELEHTLTPATPIEYAMQAS